MESRVIELLKVGGVQIPDDENPKDPIRILEAWLEVPDAAESSASHSSSIENENIGLMEDDAPFDTLFYKKLESLLIHAWNPDIRGETHLLHSNPFLEHEAYDPADMTIYKALPSTRITRLLRHWMDLNVLGNQMMLEKNEDGINSSSSLSMFLLKNASRMNDSAMNKTSISTLIQAVYHHVHQLPRLNSELHSYTQALMRGDRQSFTSGVAITDAHVRLQQYQVTQTIIERLNQEWENHINDLEFVLGEWYALGSVDIRRQSRMHLGSVWAQFVASSGSGVGGSVKSENTSSSGIRMTLRILYRILMGVSDHSLEKSHSHLLQYHLLPLHKPSSMVLWRDQTSLLELYHEPLVQCIATLLQKRPDWIGETIASLLKPEIWSAGGNTPKLVLLLHEIDTYIGLIPSHQRRADFLNGTWPSLLRTIGGCMSSEHSRLAERALSFAKTKNFMAIIQESYEQSVQILLSFLVKSEPSWNPTVRKMTYNVMKALENLDEKLFWSIADHNSSNELTASPAKRPGETLKIPSPANSRTQQTKDFSLKSAMGEWKPPGAKVLRGSKGSSMIQPKADGAPKKPGKAPPLGVTGFAPWHNTSAKNVVPKSHNSGRNPPLTVTGVAPWAAQQNTPSLKRSAAETLQETDNSRSKTTSRVRLFMNKIKPPEIEGGLSPWSKSQMAESPILLPNLKFHDLVFGHDLGSGAFGSVKYARMIDRSKTRSHWPEYAVKIISTEKITEMGYEASVQREVAVLQVLSHPCIARLVSSFRFQEGVYLVLEYASGGDLHSLLRKHGSLDHDSTRFVMGEVLAALSSIHDVGLVYSDLKPENIVITESGHVKLTDFGGCRPVTNEARILIQSVAKHLLRNLRDGGWKRTPKDGDGNISDDPATEEMDMSTDESTQANEMRIEGTTAYLPPEVVLGALPTFSADSWAFGCVLYQCLSGRPPMLEVDDASTRHKIVSFHGDGSIDPSDKNQLFKDAHSSIIDTDAQNLITRLLKRHPLERPSLLHVARDDFFVEHGIDVFKLYTQTAPPLDVGDVTPVADAQWTRRQFSSIWAPQPEAYDIKIPSTEVQRGSSDSRNAPIPEGAEATAFFSKTQFSVVSGQSSKKPPRIQTTIIEETEA